MKWINERILHDAGWHKLVVGATLPSYCVECGSQKTHVIVARGVFDRGRVVKLCCFDCDSKQDVD